MESRIKVKNVNHLDNNKIFLDTNIWIYLFCPFSRSRDFIVKKYSRAFNYLIRSKNEIFIDITVLSEFINRYLRIAYEIYKENNNKKDDFQYKRDYKQTDDFKETARLIFSTIKNKILVRVSVINPEYANNDIDELISGLNERLIDFNDLHIERLCKHNNFYLLTDDGDFSDSSIGIISGNPKFFS